MGVAPTNMAPPLRHHFRWGHHFSWGGPCNGSQLNCHKRSGTGKLSYSSDSAPCWNHFSWGHQFSWGRPCSDSQMNCNKRSGTSKFRYSSVRAILATL